MTTPHHIIHGCVSCQRSSKLPGPDTGHQIMLDLACTTVYIYTHCMYSTYTHIYTYEHLTCCCLYIHVYTVDIRICINIPTHICYIRCSRVRSCPFVYIRKYEMDLIDVRLVASRLVSRQSNCEIFRSR